MPINNVIEGDLIKLAKEGRYTEICHGCNCQNNMGKGIAPLIAKAFPAAKEADQATKKGDSGKLGSYSLASIEGTDLTVFNLYTQDRYNAVGENVVHLDYTALRLAFKRLNKQVKANKEANAYESFECFSEQVMGIPLIGAGLGGGDWNKIEKIINEVTPDINIELVKFKK